MNIVATQSIARWRNSAAIDERVAQIDANGVVTFMHNDKQNSVIAISDTAGNPVVRRGYGTYGETDPAQMTGTTSAGSSAHPFGYTGRRWDNDLGLYYYRARWYDPQLGTFLEKDPIGSLDYVNLYAYVGAEPGNATDPTGMFYILTGSTTEIATMRDTIRDLREKSGTADKIIGSVQASDTVMIITVIEVGGNSYHRPQEAGETGLIEWQADEGGASKSGNQSPALGLVEEFVHAARSLEDPLGYTADTKVDVNGNSIRQHGAGPKAEEERATVVVNTIAMERGEAQRDGYRDSEPIHCPETTKC